MVTQQAKKELTVEQYEFYKTQKNPMTDAQIMKIYDLDNNKLYAWKKKNKLIGKNYNKPEESNLKIYKKSEADSATAEAKAPENEEVPLLKENDILEKERTNRILEGINQIKGYSANSKLKEKIDQHKEKTVPPNEKVTLSVPENVPEPQKKTVADDASAIINQLKVEMEEYKKQAAWLEKRHQEDVDKVVDLKQQVAAYDRRVAYMEIMEKVNLDVTAERHRQNEIYGFQRHDYGKWLAILAEEFGEVAQAMQRAWGWGKETDAHDLYKELVHTSAVARGFAEHVLENRMKVKEGSALEWQNASDADDN